MTNGIVLMNLADLKEAINQVLDERVTADFRVESQKEELVSRNELCKLLGISDVTLWRMEKEGRLAPIKVGGRNLYNKAEVVALIKAGKLAKYSRMNEAK